jgi:acetyl-CoA synthetase
VSAFDFGGEIAWRPTPEYIERSRLTAFMRKHGLRDYAQLMRRSTTDLDWFWRAVLDDLGIEFYEPYRAVLDTSRGIARTQWCVGGRMNIVHNCLDKWMGTPVQHRPALHWEGEEGTTRTMTYEQLHREVNRCANGLRRMGIARGDRVALFMPMCPELVAAFFAVINVGGIVLPLFSDTAPTRSPAGCTTPARRRCSPRMDFWRRGQIVAMKATADQAVAVSPSCST